MKLRNALLVATMFAAPAVALAQPVTGPYISLGAGGNYIQDQNLNRLSIEGVGTSYGTYNNGHIRTDANVLGSGAVGYGLGNGFRIELQGDYTKNTITSFSSLNGGGREEQYKGFVNVLYDFDLSPFGLPLAPYVGVGAGYDQVKFQNGHASGYVSDPAAANGVDTVFLRTTNTQGNFAAQGILGVAYNVAAVPGLALTLEGRVSAIPETQDYRGQFFAPGIATRVNFRTDYTLNYEGVAGIRYALFSPPPPVQQQAAEGVQTTPPVTQARTHLVFFDWDRADLTARARQIVAEAASASTHVQTTQIEVNGYTDLSGTAAYNQRLSVRRAQSVESELVRDGVNRSEISIHGFGESNPLVQTAAGVREPQNRRVEIILK